MTEEEAARFVRAALRLMMDRIPDDTDLMRGLLETLEDVDSAYADALAAPWADEPTTEPAPVPWGQVAEGDWARGADGKFYLVKGNRAENGKAYVTLRVRGKDGTYAREPDAEVMLKRGPVGQAVDVLAAVGLDPAVLASS